MEGEVSPNIQHPNISSERLFSPEESEKMKNDLTSMQALSQVYANERYSFGISGGYAVEGHCEGKLTRYHQDIDAHIWVSGELNMEEEVQKIQDVLGGEDTKWKPAITKGKKIELFEDKADGAIGRRIEVLFLSGKPKLAPETKSFSFEGQTYEIPVEHIAPLTAHKIRLIKELNEERGPDKRKTQPADFQDLIRLLDRSRFPIVDTIDELESYFKYINKGAITREEARARAAEYWNNAADIIDEFNLQNPLSITEAIKLRLSKTPSGEKLQKARQILEDKELIDHEYDDLIDKTIENIQFGLSQMYGQQIRQLFEQFKNNMTPRERILIINDTDVMYAQRAILNHLYGVTLPLKPIRVTDKEARPIQIVGQYHDIGIFMASRDSLLNYRPIPQFQYNLSHEILHDFLRYTRQQKLAGSQREYISGVYDNIKRLTEEKRLSQKYVSNDLSTPEEQVVDGLVHELFRASGQDFHLAANYRYSNVNKKYLPIRAQMGKRRIEELGIEKILNGDYITNHEQDYRIEYKED